MSEIINLNKFRKTHERQSAKAQADANAAKFGRSKAQRLLDAAQEEQMRARLDQLRFEDE